MQNLFGIGKKILEEMQCATDIIFVWLDSKFFTVGDMVKYQNDKAYTTSPGIIPKGVSSQFL